MVIKLNFSELYSNRLQLSSFVFEDGKLLATEECNKRRV